LAISATARRGGLRSLDLIASVTSIGIRGGDERKCLKEHASEREYRQHPSQRISPDGGGGGGGGDGGGGDPQTKNEEDERE